jgi:hypothetical protein
VASRKGVRSSNSKRGAGAGTDALVPVVPAQAQAGCGIAPPGSWLLACDTRHRRPPRTRTRAGTTDYGTTGCGLRLRVIATGNTNTNTTQAHPPSPLQARCCLGARRAGTPHAARCARAVLVPADLKPQYNSIYYTALLLHYSGVPSTQYPQHPAKDRAAKRVCAMAACQCVNNTDPDAMAFSKQRGGGIK